MSKITDLIDKKRILLKKRLKYIFNEIITFIRTTLINLRTFAINLYLYIGNLITKRFWFFITVLFMFSFLYLGNSYINTNFNGNDIYLVLSDSNLNNTNHNGGKIHCYANDGKYLTYNKLVLCREYPELVDVLDMVVEFTLHNGSQIRLDENDIHNRLKFRIPEKVEGISFYLSGYDRNKTYHYLIGGKNSNIIAPEEEEIYEDRLIMLRIWLVGAMFLIPTMMHNLKKLWAE